jgi:hypothetical protein
VSVSVSRCRGGNCLSLSSGVRGKCPSLSSGVRGKCPSLSSVVRGMCLSPLPGAEGESVCLRHQVQKGKLPVPVVTCKTGVLVCVTRCKGGICPSLSSCVTEECSSPSAGAERGTVPLCGQVRRGNRLPYQV